jgi:hypothetical protein
MDIGAGGVTMSWREDREGRVGSDLLASEDGSGLSDFEGIKSLEKEQSWV